MPGRSERPDEGFLRFTGGINAVFGEASPVPSVGHVVQPAVRRDVDAGLGCPARVQELRRRDERMADLVPGPCRGRARRGVAIPSRLACHCPAKPGRRGGETAGNRKRHHPDRSPLRGGNVRAGRARHGELASARSRRQGQGPERRGRQYAFVAGKATAAPSSAGRLRGGSHHPGRRAPAGAGRLAFVSKRQVSATSRHAAGQMEHLAGHAVALRRRPRPSRVRWLMSGCRSKPSPWPRSMADAVRELSYGAVVSAGASGTTWPFGDSGVSATACAGAVRRPSRCGPLPRPSSGPGRESLRGAL